MEINLLIIKPFISFKKNNDGRLETLGKIFKFRDRILNYDEKPNILLLKTPLSFNRILLNKLKIKSLHYLKKNLNIIK